MIKDPVAHVYNDSALNEMRKMRRRIGALQTDRLLLSQFKLLEENKVEISRLRTMVGRLQDRLRNAIEENKKYHYDETLQWALDVDLKDVGSPDQV